MRAEEAKRLLSRIERKAGCDYAVKVKQLIDTAERVGELESQIATLTAELAKARSGEAWVGEQIKAGDWIHGGQFYWQEDEPIDCLILRRQPSSVSTCVGSETTDYRYCYRYTGPTTAPLPPAAPAPEEAGRKQMLDAYPEDVNHCAEPTPTPAPAKPEWRAAVEVVAEERACMPGGESRDLYILAEAVLELAAAIEQE